MQEGGLCRRGVLCISSIRGGLSIGGGVCAALYMQGMQGGGGEGAWGGVVFHRHSWQCPTSPICSPSALRSNSTLSTRLSLNTCVSLKLLSQHCEIINAEHAWQGAGKAGRGVACSAAC